MTLESAIVTYVTFGVILVIGFAVLSRTNISLAPLLRRRRKQVIEVAIDDDILDLPEGVVVENQVVMWNDIQVHDRADEFIKISGTIDGAANYYIIGCVGHLGALVSFRPVVQRIYVMRTRAPRRL